MLTPWQGGGGTPADAECRAPEAQEGGAGGGWCLRSVTHTAKRGASKPVGCQGESMGGPTFGIHDSMYKGK